MPLGTGDADLNGVILLKLENYHGPLIMQVYRDNEGSKFSRNNLDTSRIMSLASYAAIIPARSGSKSIPDRACIRLLGGHP